MESAFGASVALVFFGRSGIVCAGSSAQMFRESRMQQLKAARKARAMFQTWGRLRSFASGQRNGDTTLGKDGCTIGCAYPHFCGDGIVDPGEGCDFGEGANGTPGQPCSANCVYIPG